MPNLLPVWVTGRSRRRLSIAYLLRASDIVRRVGSPGKWFRGCCEWQVLRVALRHDPCGTNVRSGPFLKAY